MTKKLLLLTLAISFAAHAGAEDRRRAVITEGVVPAPQQAGFSAEPENAEFIAHSPFRLPLFPNGGTSVDENKALAEALQAYSAAGAPYDLADIIAFLDDYPESAWSGSLYLNVGLIQRYNGFLQSSFESFEAAWDTLKNAEEPSLQDQANRAVAELIAIKAGLGRQNELDELFEAVKGRKFTGESRELLANARLGLAAMRSNPESSFNCGPAALLNVLAHLKVDSAHDARIMAKAATSEGLNLDQVSSLANEIGFTNHTLAYREEGAFLLPSILHWKAGHFSALLEERDGRYLIEDPTLGDAMWVPREALVQETSGYFLLADNQVPEGWRSVDTEEAASVWGKGKTNLFEDDATRAYDKKACQNNGNPGMPGYNVHLLLCSLNVTDTPIWVNTPYGLPISFTLTYNQREVSLGDTGNFGYMGKNWTHNWQGWVETEHYLQSGSGVPLSATRVVAGGGEETYSINGAGDGYKPNRDTQAELTALFDQGNLSGYRVDYPDGSYQLYEHEQFYNIGFARYLLSELIDPYGNTVTIDYDSWSRIKSIATDALSGPALKFVYAYDGSGNPIWPSPNPSQSPGSSGYLIKEVIGPQGRYTSFTYNQYSQIKKVVDMAGLETEFAYDPVTGYMGQMDTPYGTTQFQYPDEGGSQTDVARSLVVIDPEGQKERFEYSRANISSVIGTETVPPGAATGSHLYDDLNSFHWDKRAMETAVNPDGTMDYGHATMYHWMLADSQRASSVLHSVKRPLENRDWLIYDDSPDGGATVGETTLPSATSRYVKDETGTTVLRTVEFDYNTLGRVTRTIDPLGREIEIGYASKGIDPIHVKQRVGAGPTDFETLTAFDYDEDNDGNDDFPRLPSLIDGTDGVRFDLTYNSKGQILSVTRQKPDGQGGYVGAGTTDYTYATAGTGETYGFLDSVAGPDIGGQRNATSYTFDAYGRVKTSTDTDNFTLTYAYDDLDRIIRVTYAHKTTDGQERELPFLEHITHSVPSGTISQHHYLRNENGWIDLWQQNDGTQWQSYDYRYDQAGQLETSRKYDGLDGNSPLLERNEYRYDRAGNRSIVQTDGDQLNDTHNGLNQLSARSVEGGTLFHGTISEEGKVFVQKLDGGGAIVESVEAKLYSGNEFYASLGLDSGTHTIRIVARDIHGETTTQDYSVAVATTTDESFTHDAAGNLTTWTKADGTVITYKWDAANRLREVLVDSVLERKFLYDGAGRLIRTIDASILDDYFWDGMERLGREQYSTSTQTVLENRRYLSHGFTRSLSGNPAQNYFVTRDHLGSTREVLDSSYAVVARYDYSPWGEVEKISGSIDADQLYTGHLYSEDADTPLHLAPYRAYQPALGRWLSRDFLGEFGPDGANTYSYVKNDPINSIDPTGMARFAFNSLAMMDEVSQSNLIGDFGLTADCFSENLFAQASVFIAKEAAVEVAIIAATGGAAIVVKAILRKAEPLAKQAARKIPHKNSLDYVGETHVYRIKGPNGTYKIGESAQGVRVGDGASIRAEQQARRLIRETGDRFETDIRRTFPDKRSAREYESKLIERFRRMFGDSTLPGNKTNR